MSYSIYLADQGRALVHIGKGVVTFDDLLAAAHVTNRNPEAVKKFAYAFIDFSDVAELLLSGEEVRDVVLENNLTAELTPLPGFVAILAPLDGVFGMARMWATMVEKFGWHTHVVRRREEALEWLNVVAGPVDLTPSSEVIEVRPAH